MYDKSNTFSPLVRIIANDPGLRAVVEGFQNRAETLKRGRIDNYDRDAAHLGLPGEELVPYLSAISVSSEIRSLFANLLDRAALADSERIKAGFRSGEVFYIPTVVIGGGVNGASFNGGFNSTNKEGLTLTVDASSKLGGQFRQHGTAIRINSSNSRVKAGIPGEVRNENFNDLGECSPFQLTQVSGEYFPDNDTLGLVVGMNQYISSVTALRTEFVSWRFNTDPNTPGRLMITLRDLDSQEEFAISTDALVGCTGLGEENFGDIAKDPRSSEVLAADRAKPTSERDLLLYYELLGHFGNSNNLFPLERFVAKRVGVVGGGHSGLTVLENLTGQGPASKGSVSALGGPDSIHLIGSKVANLEDFLAREYERYLALGIVMPSSTPKPDARGSLVTLHSGVRVVGIDTDGSTYTLTMRDKASGELSQIELDCVIFTVGFENKLDSLIFNEYQQEYRWICDQQNAFKELSRLASEYDSIQMRRDTPEGMEVVKLRKEEDGQWSIRSHTPLSSYVHQLTWKDIEQQVVAGNFDELIGIRDGKIDAVILCSHEARENRLLIASPESIFEILDSERNSLPLQAYQIPGLDPEVLAHCSIVVERPCSNVTGLPTFYQGSSSHMVGRYCPGGVYVAGPAAQLPLDVGDESRRDIAGAPGITGSISNNQDDSMALGRFLGMKAVGARNDLLEYLQRGQEKLLPEDSITEIPLYSGTSLPPSKAQAGLLLRLLKEVHLGDVSASTGEIHITQNGGVVTAHTIGIESSEEIATAISNLLRDPVTHDLIRAGYQLKLSLCDSDNVL